MLAQLLAFLGSLFNLCIDVIYKITVVMLVMFLSVIAIAAGFAVLLVWLLT
jgi:hypothetical protein